VHLVGIYILECYSSVNGNLAFVWPAAGALAVAFRLSRAGFKGCLQISSERVYKHYLQYDYIAPIFILQIM